MNELAGELKALIIDLQSDARNKSNLNPARYNNLKLKMDPSLSPSPHVVVSISISEAIFNISTGEKITGSLGPDERYTLRWLSRGANIEALRECWKNIKKDKKVDDEDN